MRSTAVVYATPSVIRRIPFSGFGTTELEDEYRQFSMSVQPLRKHEVSTTGLF